MTNGTIDRRVNPNRRRTVAVGVSSALEEEGAGIRMLVWPLAIVLVLLIALAGTLLWHQQEQRLQERIDYHLGEVSDAFYNTQAQQIAVMSAQLDAITADPALREALRKHDRERLLALSFETAERLRQRDGSGCSIFMTRTAITSCRCMPPSGSVIESTTGLHVRRSTRVRRLEGSRSCTSGPRCCGW